MVLARKSSPRPLIFTSRGITGPDLDLDSLRIFHYASTTLWPSFSQTVIESNESVAEAMTRLALAHHMTMDVFIWTAANVADIHSPQPMNRRVVLKHQTSLIQSIQEGIRTNAITDELILAVYSLVTLDTTPLKVSYRSHDESLLFGDYKPPLTSLGWLNNTSQLHFSDHHAEVAAKLLAPRGGIQNLRVTEYAYQMQAHDICRNSKTGSKPLFDLCKSYRHILETRMPLYRSYAFQSYPVSPTFNTLLLDLRTYLRQLDLYMTFVAPIVTPETLVAWRNINQHRLLSLPDDKDQLFRLATLIFNYNVTFPVPYRDLVQNWARELVAHIHKALDTSEAALWAIVVAALSRPDAEVMGCLRDKGSRIVKALNITSWHGLKTILIRYLWLDGACDVGGRNFWASLHVGESIV